MFPNWAGMVASTVLILNFPRLLVSFASLAGLFQDVKEYADGS